jgi:K+-sensing histidine kinase KdpD
LTGSTMGHSLVADEGPSRFNLSGNRPVTRLSHDIRTQLYIIIGFAELMLDEIPGKINEEQRRNLNDVLNSGKRLLELLHDIVPRSENG